jgi:hypothetical protein
LEANRHLGSLGLSLFYLASDREDGEPPSALTLTTMQVGLQLASTAAEFRERLDEAEDLDEFWAAVRAAI